MSPEPFSVPGSYAELQKQYGSHIKRLLVRSNRVEANFDDLHSYVWVKILEARLLERFEDHMERQIPKVLSALEVCDLLGISFRQWVYALEASHSGQRPHWMPTAVNEAQFRLQGRNWFSARNALFAYVDIIRLTWGERINGEVEYPFDLWGQEVDAGVVIGPSRPEGCFKLPVIHPTKSQFKNYLSTAVLNHYANFCRTSMRRHKERPQAPRLEGRATWEDSLEDRTQPAMETTVALREVRALVADTIQSCLHEFGAALTGTAESKIFTQIEEGATLLQALKEAGLPLRARKSIVRALRSSKLNSGMPV